MTLSKPATEILAFLKAHEKERFRLTDTLRMWSEAEAQGISSGDVRAFTFDPSVCTPRDCRPITGDGLSPIHLQLNRFSVPTGKGTRQPIWFNVVIMKSGERRKLAPMIKAPPEKAIACSVDSDGKSCSGVPTGSNSA